MITNQVLLERVDIETIAREGSKIYEQIKGNYGSEDKGKFLAIDIESGNAYLADTGKAAVDKARTIYPDKVFYVVRIGYSFAEALANMDAYAHGNY